MMYIKVFPHGKRLGRQAVDYLTRLDYTGRDQAPPQVLRGDTNLTKKLIDCQDRTWKYSAGVVSWSETNITPKQEEKFMQDFEKLAFAGLEADQYNILWVRHTHAKHHELHFVIPRMEIYNGKSFNAFPPNWQNDFDVLRDMYNIQNNWTRPDDPERARLVAPAQAYLMQNRLKRWGKDLNKNELEQVRELLIEYAIKRIENRLAQNRDDIIKAFQDLGLKINRQGKDYITVQDAENNYKIRLKGGMFSEHFRATTESAGTPERGQRNLRENRQRELERLAKELEQIYSKRSEYNRKRYAKPKEQDRYFKLLHPEILAQKLHNRDISDNRHDARVSEFNILHEFQHNETTGEYQNFATRDTDRGNDIQRNAEQNLELEIAHHRGQEICHSSFWSEAGHGLATWQTRSYQTGVNYERDTQNFKRHALKMGAGNASEPSKFASAGKRYSELARKLRESYQQLEQIVRRFTELVPKFAKYYEQVKLLKHKKNTKIVEIER